MRSAITAFKKALELNRNYRIGLANLGSIYLEFGDYERAVAPLEEGYSLIKSDIRKNGAEAVEIANNYAVALAGVGNGKEAKQIYEKILDSDSRNIGVLLNYATLLTKTLKIKSEARKAISRLKFVSDSAKYNKKAEELDKFLESLPD
ncbi:MAG: tetratricopeptide repeat protein [Bdellovibrionales bacterium]|nr:tetratricopeptide repeat protein [Bdellovibrionales bacterium]